MRQCLARPHRYMLELAMIRLSALQGCINCLKLESTGCQNQIIEVRGNARPSAVPTDHASAVLFTALSPKTCADRRRYVLPTRFSIPGISQRGNDHEGNNLTTWYRQDRRRCISVRCLSFYSSRKVVFCMLLVHATSRRQNSRGMILTMRSTDKIACSRSLSLLALMVKDLHRCLFAEGSSIDLWRAAMLVAREQAD